MAAHLEPYWFFFSTSSHISHGSSYAWDTNVPLVYAGMQWIKPGSYDHNAALVDIARIWPTCCAYVRRPLRKSAR